MEEIVRCIIALGSNTEKPKEAIQNAIQKIDASQGIKVIAMAKNYSNDPVGFKSENIFINTAIEVETSLSPTNLLLKLEEIEKTLGRTIKSNGEYRDRIIDLDIILFERKIISTEKLSIPHTQFRTRDFVLIPLMDINPNLIDPVTQLSVKQLVKLLPEKRTLLEC